MSLKQIPSLCPYCAVGCGLYLVVDKGKAIGIEYMTGHPASEGALCPKGNSVLEILDHIERLKYPMKKVGDGFVRISWDEALDIAASEIKRIIDTHGNKAIYAGSWNGQTGEILWDPTTRVLSAMGGYTQHFGTVSFGSGQGVMTSTYGFR